MYPFYISISVTGQPSTTIEIRGMEKAYESYRFACLGLAPMAVVDLVDGLTGEIISSSSDEWD